MNNKTRVVITGIASLSSSGNEKDVLWSNILNNRCNTIKETANLPPNQIVSYFLHKLTDFNINEFGINDLVINEILDWKQGEQVEDLYYLLACTKKSLIDSGIDWEERDDIGLILTHENPGLNQFIRTLTDSIFDKYINNYNNCNKDEYFNEIYNKFNRSVYDLQTFMFVFHIARALKIHGTSFFINNACASGLYGLELAKMLIQSNQCKAVIVAGADKSDIYKYLWFKKLGLYSEENKMRPFSDQASGFLFGDGGAGIVCESLESAIERKAKIYAEYIGGAFSIEGWKVSFPAIHKNYYKNTILKALHMNNLKENDIDLVVPHGVATGISDEYEAKALSAVFNKGVPPAYTALKPYVGHNLGASALIEVLITILALKNQTIPATLNSRPNSKINIKLQNKNIKSKIKYAMKTVNAFAGYNGAIILKEFL